MTAKTKFERNIANLYEMISALRESIKGLDREIKPGAVYKVSEIAQLVQRDETTVYRAIRGGFLISAGNRIIGTNALDWVERGLPTGKNKGDVHIKKKEPTQSSLASNLAMPS